MKWLFVLALIANIAFFTYNSLFNEQTAIPAKEKVKQTDPQIILLGEQELTVSQSNNKPHADINPANSIVVPTVIADTSASRYPSTVTEHSTQSESSTDINNQSLNSESSTYSEPVTDDKSLTSKLTSVAKETSMDNLHVDEDYHPNNLTNLNTQSDGALQQPSAAKSQIEENFHENEKSDSLATKQQSTEEKDDKTESGKVIEQQAGNVDQEPANETVDHAEVQTAAMDSNSNFQQKTEESLSEEHAVLSKDLSNQPIIKTEKHSSIDIDVEEIQITAESSAQEAEPEAVENKNIIQSRATVDNCYKFGPFNKQDLDELKIELEKSYPNRLSFEIDSLSTPTYYRIYIPPLSSSEQIKSVLKKLDDNGLTDHYVMSINGRKNAIAIGVFKKRLAAEKVAKKAKIAGFAPTIEAITKDKNSQYNLMVELSEAGDIPALKEKLRSLNIEYDVCKF